MSDYQTQMQHSRYDRTPVSILSDTITQIRYAGLPLIQPANTKRLILSTIILRMILILLRRNKVLIFYIQILQSWTGPRPHYASYRHSWS